MAFLVGAFAALGAAGCGERHKAELRHWTMFQMKQALEAGENVGMGPSMPEGRPATDFLHDGGDGNYYLTVTPVYAETQPAATITTDVWVGYKEIWLQPGYRQFVDVYANTPLRYPDSRPAPGIFDVGYRSTFYSPFWHYRLAQVGMVDAELYKSSRQLFEAGVEMMPTEPRMCPLRPLNVRGAASLGTCGMGMPCPAGSGSTCTLPTSNPPIGECNGPPVEPTYGTPLDPIRFGEAWIEGERVGLFDFAGIFAWTPTDLVVEEIPSFAFYTSDGTAPLPGARRVGGVGPAFSGRAAMKTTDAATGWPRLRFGALRRVHKVVVAATAGAFVAAEHPEIVLPAEMDLRDYEGRVASNVSCFAPPATGPQFPASCAWLDSQAKIEALGRSRVSPTEIMETSPYVFYEKLPVRH